MLSTPDVQELIAAHRAALPPLPVPLGQALHRVLRQDVLADQDMPAFTRSAMDGYLVLAGEPPGLLQVAGEVRPGAPAQPPTPGTCLRVFTGSAVPDAGAIVVKQEDVARKGEEIRILHHPGDAHVRRRGSHHRAGALLVPSGCRLTPGRLALLASAGVARPLVSPMPRVAHIATGGELVECGSVPVSGQIRDSNSPLLAALVQAHGAELVRYRRVDEAPENLGQAIDDALAACPDILLVSGGASLGDHDHTRACLVAAGFELLVQGVNNRPGKPMIVGKRGTTLAFGLPGNPLSHFVCFHLFVRRALECLSGLPISLPVRLPVLGGAALETNTRESWWPCHVGLAAETSDTGADRLCARPLPWRDSSDISALADAGGLLRVPPDGLPAGAPADVLLVTP